jgi:hypothetical protein
MHRLLPVIDRLKADAVFEVGLRLLLDGIDALAMDGKPKQKRARISRSRARNRSV